MAERLPAELVRFIQTHLRLVWALELLLILMRDPDREWTVDELVREMRASDSLVRGLLSRFEQDGLAATADQRSWRWSPATAELNELSTQLAQAYMKSPFAVIQVIAEAPSPSIMGFAEAFRLRGDRDKK